LEYYADGSSPAAFTILGVQDGKITVTAASAKKKRNDLWAAPETPSDTPPGVGYPVAAALAGLALSALFGLFYARNRRLHRA